MWGIVPAAGLGTRIQPLAFSKELLPVGSRRDGAVERPRAVSEYLLERLIAGGADKICFVIAPGKTDILNFYGENVGNASICYIVQQQPGGLCDALFRAAPFISNHESVLVGLPDTIWFPEHALQLLPDDVLSFLLFPVVNPESFDAVVTNHRDEVIEIQVKQKQAASNWIWGAFKMPAEIFHELHALWREPGRGDEYVGTLVNEYLRRGGRALGIQAGDSYVDVGTFHGYSRAIRLLQEHSEIHRNATVAASA